MSSTWQIYVDHMRQLCFAWVKFQIVEEGFSPPPQSGAPVDHRNLVKLFLQWFKFSCFPCLYCIFQVSHAIVLIAADLKTQKTVSTHQPSSLVDQQERANKKLSVLPLNFAEPSKTILLLPKLHNTWN